MANLLSVDDLPSTFMYPREFIRVVELGLTDLEPWLILEGKSLAARHRGLRERFPERVLVPFARRQDNDDIACWDLNREGRVVIVHDFASPGWERQTEFATFNGWFRRAIEDLIEFE